MGVVFVAVMDCLQIYAENKALLNCPSSVYVHEICVYACDVGEHGKEKNTTAMIKDLQMENGPGVLREEKEEKRGERH